MRPARLISITFLALALSACGQQARNDAIFTTGDGHSHSADTVRGDTPPPPDSHEHLAATSTADTYDAQFIQSMAVHHNGAIQMSEEAIRQSKRAEIKQLAEHIIEEQHKEIQQMATWLEQWYPGSHVSSDKGTPMGAMEISKDESRPFDLRFLEAMISHHQGAIDMAKEAQTKAEHPELKQLADSIIKAQTAEIEQMRGWQQQWFAK